MCLILIAWRTHPDYPLVVAANRDEFYARPTAPAGPWAEDPRILGGRDLQAGGSWLGLRSDGRFAAVTNVREPGVPKGPRSRGDLVREFLLGDAPARDYAPAIPGASYSGFNLLVSDGAALWYRSNRDGQARELPPGIYGLSNHLLDTPWPKLVAAKAGFQKAMGALPAVEGLFEVLANRELVPDPELPATGLSLEWERMLSAVFVASETYGTRASTVAVLGRDGVLTFGELAFGPNGAALGLRSLV
jgi:uncharacterized protein with NRDE domain